MSGPTPDTTYDTIEQYVDSDTGTVTVDPIRHERWIHEGGDGRHAEGVKQGRAQRAALVSSLRSRLAAEPVRLTTYLPTSAELERQPAVTRYPAASGYDHGVVAPFEDSYRWRGKPIADNRPGEWPIIEALVRDGGLPEGQSANDIARGTVFERRRVQGRVFER